MKPTQKNARSGISLATGLLAALSVLIPPALTGATLITPVAADDGQSHPPGWPATRTIEDSSMVNGSSNVVHATTNALAAWYDDGVGAWNTALAGSGIKYDLWGTARLSSLWIWNGNRVTAGSIDLRERGVKTADVYISNTGVGTPVSSPAEWTKITATPINVNMSPAFKSNEPVQQIALSSSVAARYVYLKPLTCWGNVYGDYVDIAEVRFEGSGGTVVPLADPSFQLDALTPISPSSGWTKSGSAGTLAYEGDSNFAANSHLGRYGMSRTMQAGDTVAITQAIGTVQGRAQYQLQLMFAQRTLPLPFYRVQLRADDGSIFTDIIDSGQVITTGTTSSWETVSLLGVAPMGLNGQTLSLKINHINRTGAMEDISFDDVRLLCFVFQPKGTVMIVQ
mgnify:CR=1 FL=1